ncbi:MAG TPA: VOC family protein [Chitinophaga sp.]|uniref:VOC family protein n=1 Tax=Chitinophaga sp. TaxID=1869181 RepID=UPI002C8FC424|nr:VOC family protein [Chitinophaga sp.]HVI48813.1 VOC family protein [Chitinophaga sp.]
MATKIFVNLPVRDLTRSVEFFTKLNFQFNTQFANDHGACMIVGNDIFVMLITADVFERFTQKAVCDARRHAEVLVSLSAESPAMIDDMVHRAVLAGGTSSYEPQDHEWMYVSGFQDLDGHSWEMIYMDPCRLACCL